MKARTPHSYPLGVDLVEMKKAKSLYEDARGGLDSFFTPSEVRKIKKSRRPHEKVALYLAAKEAAFKAFGDTTEGLMPFRNIRVVEANTGRLSVEIEGGALSWSRVNPKELEFFIFKDRDFILVECLKGADALGSSGKI